MHDELLPAGVVVRGRGGRGIDRMCVVATRPLVSLVSRPARRIRTGPSRKLAFGVAATRPTGHRRLSYCHVAPWDAEPGRLTRAVPPGLFVVSHSP
jgi:hypothetical protein